MKSKKIALFVLLSVTFLSYSQDKIVELPLTPQKGHGPFIFRYHASGMSPYRDNDNRAGNLKISHFPEGLTEMKYGDIDANSCQSTYQDYLLGHVTKNSLQKKHWVRDTINLSKTPIKTKIAFAYGKDSEGVMKIAVDANNNLDLSDDELFIPLDITTIAGNRDSFIQDYAVNVSLESFVHNKIVPVTVPLLIEYRSWADMFSWRFAQHMTTQYKGKKIAISSFTSLAYNEIDLVFMPKGWENKGRLDEEDIYHKNEYIEIKNKIYKILGVNTNKNALVLEKANLPKTQLFSTQIGYKAHLFEGKDLMTNSNISLESFKGKYVLLDFWESWCGSCIAEFPDFKEIYAKTDRAKFEIIGIIGDSSSDAIKKLIDKHELPWAQIMSDETSKIHETYGVQSYPTTILINPEGVIIAKNLRRPELEEKVLSLME